MASPSDLVIGGGVSVCLRSLVGFNWGQPPAIFARAVGEALWGRCAPLSVSFSGVPAYASVCCSKWSEVMPGSWDLVVPDLEAVCVGIKRKYIVEEVLAFETRNKGHNYIYRLLTS